MSKEVEKPNYGKQKDEDKSNALKLHDDKKVRQLRLDAKVVKEKVLK